MAVIAWSLLSPAIAGACSTRIIELDNVLASIDGEPVAEMGDGQIVGVVEMLVLGAWAETPTYRAASLAAPNLVWGVAPELPPVIHGGQPLVPDTTSSCNDGARRLGVRWWLAVFGRDDGGPGEAVLIAPDPDEGAQARFSEAFGGPQSIAASTVPDQHPSETLGTTDSLSSAAPTADGSGLRWGVFVVVAAIAVVALAIATTRRARAAERPTNEHEPR